MDSILDIKLQYRLDGTLTMRLKCRLDSTLASAFGDSV